MKIFLTILLAMLVLLSAIPKTLVTGLFYLQQEAIATEWCQNIEKPQLECAGKCFLGEQLKEQDKSEDKQGLPNLSQVTELTLYCTTLSINQPISGINNLNLKPSFVPFLRGASFILSLFRPPAV